MKAKTNTSVTISAVVTRADGTVEDLGVICRTAKKTWADKVKQGVKKWQTQHMS